MKSTSEDGKSSLHDLRCTRLYFEFLLRWFALRKEHDYDFHILIRYKDPKTGRGDAVAVKAAAIQEGLQQYGRDAARFVARQGGDSKLVLQWTQALVSGGWENDRFACQFFDEVRWAVEDALLRAEVKPSSEPAEEWMPANRAVVRVESLGLEIKLQTLSKKKEKWAEEWGLRVRERVLSGTHKYEVEFWSLMVCILKHAETTRSTGGEDEEPEEGEFDARIKLMSEKKQSENTID